MATRNVLRCHSGEVDRWLPTAKLLKIGEIEERDDVPAGEYQIFTESHPDVAPVDWQAQFKAAVTVEQKLVVLAQAVGLVGRPP